MAQLLLQSQFHLKLRSSAAMAGHPTAETTNHWWKKKPGSTGLSPPCASDGHVCGCQWPGSPRTIPSGAPRPGPGQPAVVCPPRRRRLLLHQPRPQEFFSPSERSVPKRSIFRAIVICKCKRFSSKIFSFHSTCYSHHIELLYILLQLTEFAN